MAAWWKKLEGRAKADANPVNPQRVVWEMSPLLPANAIVTSDSGSCANWYARDYRVQQGQSASLSGGLASMGAAVPYAIGAKFAHPDRPGDRAGRRRRHADEQHGRTDHRPEILEALGRSALDRMRVQQPGSQRSHLGTARHGGQPKIRGFAGHSRFCLRQVRRDARVQGNLRGFSGPTGVCMAGSAIERSARRPGGEDRSGRGSASAASSHSKRPAPSCRRWPRETEALAASSATPQDKSSTGCSAKRNERLQ